MTKNNSLVVSLLVTLFWSKMVENVGHDLWTFPYKFSRNLDNYSNRVTGLNIARAIQVGKNN